MASVRAQGFNDCQVILINDGSSQSYEKIRNKMGANYLYLENKSSLGVSQARNLGIEIAKYDWYCF
ncbi:glycosyltransferase [Teredinibacter haidensis]|uniref:glycosyltransferase n=1 Tax=Teredinibacter haidensis TaxID=2731755 RepID=UPI003CCCB799